METLYLNHAAMSPVYNNVKQILIKNLEKQNIYGPDFSQIVDDIKQTRVNISQILGTTPDTVAFTLNTSVSISIVANGINLKDGDEIIVPNCEYPANIYPWLDLQKRKNIKVKLINPGESGKITPQIIQKNISPKTKLCALSHVQFKNGYRANIKEILKICKNNNTFLLVDAIQSAGAFEIKANEWDIDFIAAGSHKWLQGIAGVGILYVKKDLLPYINPLYSGAFSVKNAGDFDNIDFTYKESAEKFESGTLNFLGIRALKESTNTILKHGIKNIERHILALHTLVKENCKKRKFNFYSNFSQDESSGIMLFDIPGINSKKIYIELLNKGVALSLRNGKLRISAHYTNTPHDIERFFYILDNLIKN